MQVELLRDLFNSAINEPNENNRVGNFWCFAPDYEQCLPYLKEIFANSTMKSIVAEDCKIEKVDSSFIIKDFYGGIDIYSYEDIAFLIDLWDKAQKMEYTVIRYNSEELTQ